MASNLNKAFMRAYAKDRSATTDSTPVAAPAVATPAPAAPAPAPAVPAPAAPMRAAPQSTAPAPAMVSAVPKEVTAPARPATVAGASRLGAVAQPSMEPTVFAGRYTPPKIVSPLPTKANQTTESTPVANQPVAKQPVAKQSITQPTPAAKPPAVTTAGSAAVSANTHRIPAPGIQASVAQGQPRPAPLPPTTRLEKVQEPDTGEASRVWQRIDSAHNQQALHPTNPQARPTVSASATRTAAPKRLHAAAPAPAPTPAAPAPELRIDSSATPNARQLPLVGDEANTVAEPQKAEARRRTVADFLYSAGQYNPGRVLASAEHVDTAMSAAPSHTAPMTTAVRSSDVARPVDHNLHASVVSEPITKGAQSNYAQAESESSLAEPMAEESMQRRMGQILRVDIPSNHVDTTNNGLAAKSAAQPVMATQSSLPTASMASSAMMTPAAQAMPQRMAQSAMAQSAMAQSAVAPQRTMPPARQAASIPTSAEQPSAMQAQTTVRPPMPAATSSLPPAASVDAPVAKYVLEQRRVDLAHKLNEAEQKLRHNTHKIFNPVWEVDNLQWPAVVDKLMQQRAQSMAHVAEHLKTACQDGLSVLGVTSAGQGEGRTTVACCLARLAAAHGLNVALVDIDLDHPTLCVQTNMEVELDWRDCLNEDVTLEEVAVHSIDDQLTVLPLKPRGGRPGLLASDARIADILTDLSECFELVIVDCAKTTSSGNIVTGLAHTKIFDAAILVVDRRDGEADRIEDAVRTIQQTGIESIGIVDNFSM